VYKRYIITRYWSKRNYLVVLAHKPYVNYHYGTPATLSAMCTVRMFIDFDCISSTADCVHVVCHTATAINILFSTPTPPPKDYTFSTIVKVAVFYLYIYIMCYGCRLSTNIHNISNFTVNYGCYDTRLTYDVFETVLNVRWKMLIGDLR